MKWRPILIAGLACVALVVLVIWLQHARLLGHWLQVHTGTVNEPGPYLLNVKVTPMECVYPMVPAGAASVDVIELPDEEFEHERITG